MTVRTSLAALGVCALGAGGLVWHVATITAAIERQSTIDEARPSDVIVVLGAAEYRGRPSPVLQARLNHAIFLYRQHLAPYIFTTGGKGPDPTYSEGEVAHAYLSRHGIPSEAIFVESKGETTAQSIAAAREMMMRLNLKSCIVVSDGYHIYRVKRMLETLGLQAWGSPRPENQPGDPGSWRQRWVYARQAIAYELWRAGVPI
jgi:uncharacterized SAM-binding protein YcdF (DUF218 family)